MADRTDGIDPALAERTIHAFASAAHIGDHIRLQVWDRRGLTMAQVRMLILLRDRDGQMLSELAGQIRVAPATMTKLSDRLVQQQLIERRDDPTDRRVIRVALTAAGRSALSEAAVPSHAYFNRMFAAMGPEDVEALASSLEQLVEAAELVAEQEEPAP